MGRAGRGASRGEIVERVGRSKQELDEREEAMEIVADDHDVVESTLSSLDFGGTLDGSNAVEENIRHARDVTETVFDDRDREMERTHQEVEGFNRELNDGATRDGSDLDKVAHAESSVRTRETSNELQRARDSVREDMEFLKQRIATVDEYTTGSERARDALRKRVRSTNYG